MPFTSFVNCRLAERGELVDGRLVASEDTGRLLERTGFIGGEIVDLEDRIVAPGFLELHTNGANGFHFTRYEDAESYTDKVDSIAKYYATQGVTGFWATVPTVTPGDYQKILPNLEPRGIPSSATLLGAHAEGPYLAPTRKGAHNSSLFTSPDEVSSTIYGGPNLGSALKLVTLAPELPHSGHLIASLASMGVKVSLGHSEATYTQGLDALLVGANGLTHAFNAMPPLHHRQPGLLGLISLPANSAPPPPFYSIIADGHHLHPSVVSLLYHANPSKAMLVTDSIELAGLKDGVHPGHAQIPHEQRKAGTKATIEGTDTLVGGCISLQESVRNLMAWSGCGIAAAVRTVTENVADFMGESEIGKLETGRWADFVVLDDEGEVWETWIKGMKVWERAEND